MQKRESRLFLNNRSWYLFRAHYMLGTQLNTLCALSYNNVMYPNFKYQQMKIYRG